MHPMRVKRFFRGMSLDELGSRTGIDQGKLSRIERDYIKPKKNEKTQYVGIGRIGHPAGK